MLLLVELAHDLPEQVIRQNHEERTNLPHELEVDATQDRSDLGRGEGEGQGLDGLHILVGSSSLGEG